MTKLNPFSRFKVEFKPFIVMMQGIEFCCICSGVDWNVREAVPLFGWVVARKMVGRL